jgi:class 3 adenylate cyclase/tetratricopeptide (TPR) repeat protein
VDCSACGTANEAGRKFCRECGTRLAAGCPSCGAQNAADAKFCGECGTPLDDRAPVASLPAPEPRPNPVAERRLVSVLFADLVGFTSYAEERDAEEVRETLSRYFDLARETIVRYGGTVEKFIGDAVMAVWGAPVAFEDDAERAVRAALDLTDSVRTLGPTIEARAGVLTGEAAVTIGATNEGMVAGDLVNTAARLQAVAPPGAVLVGETTQRASAVAIVFEPVGDQQLKGKTAPVPAWIARRVVAERGGRNRADTLEPPFVGRDVELRLLKDLFHATARERRARLVSVTGQAGIGKSRLAWEFLKYIDGLVETIYWHQGRSPAYGNGLTMWALGEMVRGRIGVLETADEPTTRAALSETLVRFVPDPAERDWLEPSLLALLGVGDRSTATEQLFGAWRTFFERVAAQGPTVLVFEDLQWADAAQLDFIDHLLEWARESPIFVLTLARPELLERRAEWSAGRRGFAALALEPLTPSSMRDLIDGVVPGLPERFVARLVDRADGIPLYAVEMIRMLIADGRVTEHDGSYRPATDVGAIAIPETLQALIAARLDALDRADRSVIQDASVLGHSFTTEALAAVSGLDEATLRPQLRRLVQRELLDLEVDSRSPERGQHRFVQGLIREVAYGSLARADRKARHLAAARHFESLGTEELAGVLAVHYLAAHELAAPGPESDALAGQCRIALRAAADRAVAIGAHDAALGYFRQAIALADEARDRAELLERAGRSAMAAFRRDEAEAMLAEAVRLMRQGADRKAIVRTTTAYGRTLVETLRSASALEILGPAVEEFADLSDDADYAELRSQFSRAYFMHGEPDAAIEAADAVLPMLERLDLLELLADTMITKGSALGTIGRLREGNAILLGGYEIARTHRFVMPELRGAINLSASLTFDSPRVGLETAKAGMTLARQLGLHGHMGSVLGNAAGIATMCGDWEWVLAATAEVAGPEPDPALRAFMEAAAFEILSLRRELPDAKVDELERLFADESDPNTQANVRFSRLILDLAEGRFDAAADRGEEIAALDPFSAPIALIVAAEAALWGRDVKRTERALGRLAAQGSHGRYFDVVVGAADAGLAALRGDRGRALAGYRTALAAYDALDIPFELAREVVIAAWLLGADEPTLSERIEVARAVLERLGAVVLLERLDAAPRSATVSDAAAGSAALGDREALEGVG